VTGPALASGPQFSVIVTCRISVGPLLSDALADAAAYRRDRAAKWCPDCQAHPDGACPGHVADLGKADEYDHLADELAELPADHGRAQ
jgi:hypothetical protein